jgi:3'-phosphoadenosine 5'-phosphosulfate (PAPS) 3'-phosphatase
MIIDANFLENLSDDLKKIVLDASEAIMQVYKKNTFNTEIKSDGSPVTEADENANKIIIQVFEYYFSRYIHCFRRNL